jgi:hypothetical protein
MRYCCSLLQRGSCLCCGVVGSVSGVVFTHSVATPNRGKRISAFIFCVHRLKKKEASGCPRRLVTAQAVMWECSGEKVALLALRR